MTVTTLAYTGGVQTYTVPAGVTSVMLECWGAAGAVYIGAGGLGGYAKGVLVVSPGTVLNVYVGGLGVTAGGWNGGGSSASYGGGGGASDVRLGGTALSNRVVVAGGGGGAGGVAGGDGGGSVGGGGASGGTQSTGYALGQGGPGTGGGAGGGGYWGGLGGTSYPSAGGGGSGYTGTLLTPTMTNGLRSGNGQVVITPTTNTAPLAPTLNLPATNSYVYASAANTFTWTVNDNDPGDSQTRADFQWRVGAGAWTVVNNAATTAAQYVVAGATFTAGTLVEWQVSTYDVASLQSPWSASSFINVIAALTAPTIIAPAAASSQFSTPVSMSWTLPAGPPSSDAYQVVRSSATGATGTVYYDSGTVLSSALSASVPLDATAGRTDYLNVRFRFGGLWSPYGSSTINNQFGPPQTPLLVCTPDPATASVSVEITNPAAGGGYATTTSNDVTRTSPDGTVDRIAKGLPPNATVIDYFVGANLGDHLNDYKVVAYAASGSTAVSA